jgi:hypothetical protein
MPITDTTSLEELFAEAGRELHKARRLKAADPAPEAPAAALFSNPANWTRKRGIALVHAETQTLLGNFTELVHRSVVGARRLVRESTPMLVEATEYVSGDWWLGTETPIPEAPKAWHERRSVISSLELSDLAVSSPIAELLVHLAFGGVERVELAADTLLAQSAGPLAHLVMLPAGTNILPAMTQDCKVALRLALVAA